MPNLKLLRPGLLLLILIGITTAIFPAATLLAVAPPWASGATNVLVIMVQFPADPAGPDGAQPAVNCSFSAAQMQANLFGATATGPGNLADYYNEVSFGALNLNGTVVGCFTVANDKNDYDDGPLGAANLVREAVALADPISRRLTMTGMVRWTTWPSHTLVAGPITASTSVPTPTTTASGRMPTVSQP